MLLLIHPMNALVRFGLVFAVLASTACAAAGPDDAASGSADITAGSPRLAATERAFAELDRMRSADPIGRYYEGGTESTRVRACWANPAGRDLTDMQKAFYCAVPLELRLCNSPIILHNDLKTATAGDQNETFTLNNGWKQCQGSTETLFPGRFAWTAEINDLYLNLFLRQSSGLTAAEEARIIGGHKPTSAGFFPTLLVSSVALLNDEAGDFGYSLIGLVRDAQIEDASTSDL